MNANGVIDNIAETLSEYYTWPAGTGGDAGTRPYAHGFAALLSLDSNADNAFTSADAAWNNLRVWGDADHDGATDAGELKTFADLGITSINLAATAQSGLVREGNEILASGTFVQDGQTREALAANFIASPDGHSFSSVAVAGNNGVLTTSQGDGAVATVRSYSSSQTAPNPDNTLAGETIDVATIVSGGVNNAYGGSGNDTLTGDAGVNWLVGGAGSDTYSAGGGEDVLLIDASDLQANIHAGAGLDLVQIVGDAGVTLNLTQAEAEIVQGGRGDDILIGGGRSSVFISGGEGEDILIGGAANDALSGEDGDDLVDGGAGNDLVRGHRGRDTLLGGAARPDMEFWVGHGREAR